MAFDLSKVAPHEPSQEWTSNAGRGVSPETEAASQWLLESWEYRDADDIGKTMAITVAQGDYDEAIKILNRAATRTGLGKDTSFTPLKGGKLEIQFRARAKRERKSADA